MSFGVYMDYYITVNGTRAYLAETTYFGMVEKNCVTKLYLRLEANQVCATMFINQLSENENEIGYCQLRFDEPHDSLVMLYAEDERNIAETRRYFLHSAFVTPTIESHYSEFCFPEKTVSDAQLAPGSYLSRRREFSHVFYRDGRAKVTAVYSNEHSSYVLQNVAVTATDLQLAMVFVPAAVSLVFVGVGIWYYARSR